MPICGTTPPAYPSAIHAVVGRVEDCVHRNAGEHDHDDFAAYRPSRDAIDVHPPCTEPSASFTCRRSPTMARDARRLLDGGYLLLSLKGFDLFPEHAARGDDGGVWRGVKEGCQGCQGCHGCHGC